MKLTLRDVASLGAQPKGPLDGLQPYSENVKVTGVWYRYDWIVDYLPNARKFSFKITGPDGSVTFYDAVDLPNWNSNENFNLVNNISSFWVEYNSSQATSHDVSASIWIRNLKVYW